MVRRLLIAVVALAASSSLALAQGRIVPSNWKNQRGSELSIAAVDAAGKLSGKFVNRAADFSCENETFDISGQATLTRITFTVTWKNATANCNAITTWVGLVGKSALATTWQHAYIDPKTNRIKVRWGRDVFRPEK